MTQAEVRQVMTVMKNFVSKDAIQLIGTAFDNEMGEELRVTVVATGRHAVAAAGERSSARGDSLQFDFGSAACRYAAADGCDGSSDARCCSAAGL